MHALVLLALVACAAAVLAENVEMRVRIRPRGDDEKTLTRDTLVRIKQFILKNGQKETYCNMYNGNPAYHTKNFRFYLNPDSGPANINCDPAKSDFNNLTIRSVAGGKNQYRTVDFVNQHAIYIGASWPTDDLSVRQLRQFVEEALQEILKDIDKGEASRQPATRGATLPATQPSQR